MPDAAVSQAMSKALLVLLALAVPAAADKPRFTPMCDYDGWTCYDGFPAIDKLTIANVVTTSNGLALELVSIASGKVLRREIVFDAGSVQRSDHFNRALARFRSMSLEKQDGDTWIYKLGTVELTIRYCEGDPCRTTYRVRRLRR